jgi:hypothetical protein
MPTRHCVPGFPSVQGEQCQSADIAVKNSDPTAAIATRFRPRWIVRMSIWFNARCLRRWLKASKKGQPSISATATFKACPARNAHHRAELHRSQSELLDQLVKAHQAGDAAEVDLLLDRLTVAHMAVTFEELIDFRASQAATGATTVEDKKRSAG